MDTELNRHKPLYLKHRPQSLEQLVGQMAVTRTLKNALEHDKLSHAYLFTGPRGTGKTSTARILAKSINCEQGPTAQPCQECTACQEIKLGNSPAVFEIDAASNNSVDDARILIERAPLVAVGGRYKLYIIDECHMLTKEAFNALLKTIEEPPPNVIFILATTEEHKVPPTIVSRCQRLMFRLVSQDDLAPYLRQIATQEGIEIEDQAINLIARRSAGGLRDALGLLDQASLLSSPGKPVSIADLLILMGAVHEDVLLGLSQSILERNGQQALSGLNRLLMEGREPAILAMELSRHFLNLTKASYLAEAGAGAPESVKEMIIGSPEYIAALCAQAPDFERSELSQIVEQLDRLEQSLRRSSQPAMNLEIGILGLCHRQDMLLVRELADRMRVLESRLTGDAAFVREAPARRPAAPPPPAVGATPGVARTGHGPAPTPADVIQPSALPPPVREPVAADSPGSKEQPAVKDEAPAVGAMPGVARAGHGPDPTPANVIQPSALPPPVREPVAADSLSSKEQPAVKDETPVVGATPSVARAGHGPAPAQADVMQPSALPPPVREPVAAEPLSSKEQAAVKDEAGESGVDLDELWVQFIDELENRHRPTWSLVSTHAFPVNVNDNVFTIGVLKDNFQKMLENKVDHIKAAASTVLRRPVMVKIKVLNKPATSTKSSAGVAPATRQSNADQPAEEGPADNPGPSPGDPSRNERAPARLEDAADSTILKEAYGLFEGPGSRQIG